MKKLIVLLLAALLCVACNTAPAAAPLTGEQRIEGFVSALFSLPLADGQTLQTAAKPYLNDKALQELADRAGVTPGLMFLLVEDGFTLTVDSVHTEAGEDNRYTAYLLLEFTEAGGVTRHGLVDIDLRLDDAGMVEYWKPTTASELTLMAISEKLQLEGRQENQLEHVAKIHLEQALLR